MRKREQLTVSNTAKIPIYLIPKTAQQPYRAIASASGWVFTFLFHVFYGRQLNKIYMVRHISMTMICSFALIFIAAGVATDNLVLAFVNGNGMAGFRLPRTDEPKLI